jgi:Tryptophan-associated transmembrane protein (Trp_oprn_chp)
VSKGRTAALVLLGCALMLGSVTQDWARGTVVGGGAVAVSGSAAAGVVTALAWAAAAGAGALTLARPGGRRPLAAAILLAAAGSAWVTVTVLTDPAAALRPAVTAATGTTTAELTGVGTTLWPLPALLGAALVAGAGAWATARAGRWPTAATRYEGPVASSADPRDAWQAMDRGEDPTD